MCYKKRHHATNSLEEQYDRLRRFDQKQKFTQTKKTKDVYVLLPTIYFVTGLAGSNRVST